MRRLRCQTMSAVFAALLLVPGAIQAGVNVWTSLGPDGGGAGSLVVDPLNPNTVYAVTDAGLFKSTDGAETWSAVNSPPDGTGYSLVVDPQNSDTLYTASREAVFKSTD